MHKLALVFYLAWMPPAAQTAPVVVAGTVPDEATKAAILQRARALYGAARVVDQMAIGSVVAPPNWSAHMQKLLAEPLMQVTQGQLTVEGNRVGIRGDVANEALRQQVASELANSLNPTYTISNGLRVNAPAQKVLDTVLARRIIEFESGQAVLRPSGMLILDEMAAALGQIGGRKVEVIGHTDNTGTREANLALSLARAGAVRSYLAAKGIAAASIAVAGAGPDQPLADNASAEGRARNRRIEFRVAD
ncbi:MULTISPECIES: OmpA family protein [unclassified Duganella]|uniref:OmpA family protein n=1 Tax=unclassified Duganella TaxID=2636909 RepID=UPI0009EB2E0F